ncbi:MAG: AAA family ATPase [Thermoplasmata archaeon]|nr:AAA family ATPase [Thermoplasmata archaeon]
MKEVPSGIDDFRTLVKGGYYYVDKTALLDRVLSSEGKVFIFTRPRRFGKSLNLSMIDAYLNMDYADESAEWFDGLDISRIRPDDPARGAYPVIRLNLQGLLVGTHRTFVRTLAKRMSELFARFSEVRGSLDERDRRIFDKVYFNRADEADLSDALLFLTRVVMEHHGRKVVLLIDEYDNPINNSYGTRGQKENLDLIKSIFNNGLKSNDNLAFAVVTGIMRIAKESIFSGLNNLVVDNIFSVESGESFGFTEDEVRIICDSYGHPERFDEAKQWYDGYRFGKSDIYNPWSILAYVERGFEPSDYWSGTSGNAIIDDLLSRALAKTCLDLTRIGDRETVSVGLDERVTFSDISSGTTALYAVMVMSGYLKAVPEGGRSYTVSVPNLEMNSVFARHILASMSADLPNLASPVIASVLNGDTAGIEANLRRFMETYDFKTLGKEHTYQVMLGCMFATSCFTHRVVFEGMSGDGYYDLLLVRTGGTDPNILIEFKALRGRAERERLESEAAKALAQIHGKRYAEGMEDVILYGMAFRGKSVAVVMDDTMRRARF